MTKAEQFIKDYTRNCSNEILRNENESFTNIPRKGEYNLWLTPEQALRAVEIEREELLEKACKYLQEHLLIDYWSKSAANDSQFIESFEQYMKGE